MDIAFFGTSAHMEHVLNIYLNCLLVVHFIKYCYNCDSHESFFFCAATTTFLQQLFEFTLLKFCFSPFLLLVRDLFGNKLIRKA